MKWNIFKPRRAIRESVKEGSKKNIVLEDGELMVVRKSADGALVKGVKSDIYIGNGTTTMEELKPALYGDTSEEPITVTPDESPDSTTALNKVTSGKPLSELVGSLKRAIETGGGGFNDIISLDSEDEVTGETGDLNYASWINIYNVYNNYYFINKLSSILYETCSINVEYDSVEAILNKWTEQYELNNYVYMVFGGDENPCIGFATATEGTEGESGQLLNGYCYAQFNYDSRYDEEIIDTTWNSGESITFANGYHNFGIYDDFFTPPGESVDYRPKKDSYASNLVIDVYQESETNPTSETFVSFCPYLSSDSCYFLQGIANLKQGTDNVEFKHISFNQDPIDMYKKNCPYNNRQYKFYYYCIDNSNFYEIWSNGPIIYSRTTMNNGSFIYGQYGGQELIYNASDELSIYDFAIYLNGNYTQYIYSTLDTTGSNTITNLFTDDSIYYDTEEEKYINPYESEILDFLRDQYILGMNDWVSYGRTYGLTYDFKHAIMYENYLVIPHWFGGLEATALIPPFSILESCISHSYSSSSPSYRDFVVFKYKNPITLSKNNNLINPASQYIYMNIGCAIINSYYPPYNEPFDLRKEINIHNLEIPDGYIGFSEIHYYTSDYNEKYKVRIHLEYSDNSLVYQEELNYDNIDNNNITYTQVTDALGFDPISSYTFQQTIDNLGLGSKSRANLIIRGNNYGSNPDPQWKSCDDLVIGQFLQNVKIKLMPVPDNVTGYGNIGFQGSDRTNKNHQVNNIYVRFDQRFGNTLIKQYEYL